MTRYDNPIIHDRFNSIYKSNIQNTGVLDRAINLQNKLQQGKPLTKHQRDECEAIDQLKLRVVQIASSKCRKRYLGGVPFSFDILPYWNKIEAWQLFLDIFNGRNVGQKFLRQALKKANVQDKLYTKSEAITELSTAWKRYRTIKQSAKFVRPNWLEQKALACELRGQGNKAGNLRSLIKNEELRNGNKQIKFTLDKMNGGIVGMVRETDGTITTVQDKEPLESAIMKENQAKYMLPYDSLPLSALLVNVLQSFGLTGATVGILTKTMEKGSTSHTSETTQ
eukprot:CAMPEP_0178899372 /NCGR_PEP_ID=MMETSP0786-20121207/2860_1 /TAXON_ID=186022 /ORGANISM="Thalassionema frauenfeldii, Strain CCMP 1798" /LENGTH=280 /DNA_ID=CAMNT_0020570215 /DNA_START=421 /DNA_END=1263 /DNA_ORIENTATION=+